MILSNTQSVAATAAIKKEFNLSANKVLSQQNGKKELVQEFLPKALSSDTSQQIKLFVQNMFASQPATGMASALRGIAARPDTSGVLKKTKLPILIINSDKDVVVPPKESAYMHRLAKNS